MVQLPVKKLLTCLQKGCDWKIVLRHTCCLIHTGSKEEVKEQKVVRGRCQRASPVLLVDSSSYLRHSQYFFSLPRYSCRFLRGTVSAKPRPKKKPSLREVLDKLREQDAQIQQLSLAVDSLRNDIHVTIEAETKETDLALESDEKEELAFAVKRRQRIPSKIVMAIKQIHSSSDLQFLPQEGIHSIHNLKVASYLRCEMERNGFKGAFVESAITGRYRGERRVNENLNRRDYLMASQRRYKRQKSLLKRRSAYVLEEEKEFWSGISYELMSDLESDGEELVTRSPLWRSEELNNLIEEIDSRYKKFSLGYPRLKHRKVGPPSVRSRPQLKKELGMKFLS